MAAHGAAGRLILAVGPTLARPESNQAHARFAQPFDDPLDDRVEFDAVLFNVSL